MEKKLNDRPGKRTEKQREASRRNGAKSQGPVTPEGKAIASRNHTTHGLCAYKNLLLNNESPHNLDLLHQTYLQRFQPADPVELDLVEQIVAAQWRLRRYTAVETALLDETMRRHIAQLPPPSYEGERCGRAFGDLADNANSLALAGRYQARNSREYYRAMKTLLELRREIPVPPGSSPLPPATPPPRPGVHFPARPRKEPDPADSAPPDPVPGPAGPTLASPILTRAALTTLLLLALVFPAFAALLSLPQPAAGWEFQLPFEPGASLSSAGSIYCPEPSRGLLPPARPRVVPDSEGATSAPPASLHPARAQAVAAGDPAVFSAAEPYLSRPFTNPDGNSLACPAVDRLACPRPLPRLEHPHPFRCPLHGPAPPPSRG